MTQTEKLAKQWKWDSLNQRVEEVQKKKSFAIDFVVKLTMDRGHRPHVFPLDGIEGGGVVVDGPQTLPL